MSLLDSPLLKNLEGGKLPQMEIVIATESIISLVIGLIIIIIIALLAYKLLVK